MFYFKVLFLLSPHLCFIEDRCPNVGILLLQHFIFCLLLLAVESSFFVSTVFSFHFYVLGDVALMR